MPSRVRLIAIDIDGTLLPSSGTTISRRNCLALREAQAAGIHIVVATGRRHQYARPVLEQVGLAPRTVLISSNGSVVRHFDGKIIQRNLLPSASARALCPALRHFGQTMVFTFDRQSGPSLVVESMESLHRRIGLWVESNRNDMVEIVPLERAFDQDEAPIQGMLCGEIAQVRDAQRALEGMDLAANITMQRTEYAERDLGILDILPPNCSKGHALAGLCVLHRSGGGRGDGDRGQLQRPDHAGVRGAGRSDGQCGSGDAGAGAPQRLDHRAEK